MTVKNEKKIAITSDLYDILKKSNLEINNNKSYSFSKIITMYLNDYKKLDRLN